MQGGRGAALKNMHQVFEDQVRTHRSAFPKAVAAAGRLLQGIVPNPLFQHGKMSE